MSMAVPSQSPREGVNQRLPFLTLSRFFALFFALVACAPRARAWDREGHRLTAEVAEAYLTPATKEQVQKLLGKETLAGVAPWADEYRENHPETAPWHYDNIPASAAAYDRDRDCPVSRGPVSPWRDCVTDRILYFEQRLGDPSLSLSDRAQALKFLVHFVGDLHQPLHTIGDARGGNDVHVKIFGQQCRTGGGCNLHEVWDTELVEERGLNEGKHLALLLEEIQQNHWEKFGAGDPVGWTNQSHRLGQRALVRNDVTLPRAYMDDEEKVADGELAVGGLRLARVLNTILGGDPATASPEPGRTPLPPAASRPDGASSSPRESH